jgi:hypothetical protein
MDVALSGAFAFPHAPPTRFGDLPDPRKATDCVAFI